jgi:hypothetical protein
MRSRKLSAAFLAVVLAFAVAMTPNAKGNNGTSLVRGIFEVQTPGSQTWTFNLADSHAYWVAVNLASAGPIPISLVVQDPWGAAYTLFDLSFTQGQPTDAYAMTFMAPESGSYSFTISTGVGPAGAAEVMFGVVDLGPMQSPHATNASAIVLADARACNSSYTSWSYYVTLTGNTTYYLDEARGAPCSTKNTLNVTASLAGPDGASILVLGNTALPWGTPTIATGQLLQWASGWFGVEANGTYTLTLTTSGQPVGISAIVATTVSTANLISNANANSTNSTAGDSITIGSQGLAAIAGLSVSGLGIGVVATAATRRKKAGGAESGQVRRTSPFCDN